MQKKTSLGGAYARKKAYEYEGKQYDADLKDGDIITILDSGNTIVGEYGEQKVFKLKTRNGEKNFSINQTSENNLVDAFGDDSDNYVDQEVKVWIMKVMVAGKLQLVAYLSHPKAQMDDEGRFSLTGVEMDYSHEDDIDVDDLPM